MQITVTTQNGQQTVEASQVGFAVIAENWSEYRLEDGRTLRIKTVLVRAAEPKDKTVRNPDGSEIVNVQTQIVVAMDEKQ